VKTNAAKKADFFEREKIFRSLEEGSSGTEI
jgi:hypothetical protein